MKRDSMVAWAMVVTAVGMLAISVRLRASEIDESIESSFKQADIYKAYLEDESIGITAKNGVVTLTGTVAEAAHKTWARETAANLPGVRRVDDRLATSILNTTGETLDGDVTLPGMAK